MNWDKFAEIYDWEFDLICTDQQQDVLLWQDLAKKYGDPILELACGSGRITIPLAKMGLDIYALDISDKMLNLLNKRSNNLSNIKTYRTSMIDFHIDRKFKFAFISYSSLQQLLCKEDQLITLKNVYQHLYEDGVLAIDIGTGVCEGPDQPDYKHLYTAEYPLDKSNISMFTSYTTDRENRIRHWKDKYVKVYEDGSTETIFNNISLMDCNEDYMRQLLEEAGFNILYIFGTFNKDTFRESSNNAIYITQR